MRRILGPCLTQEKSRDIAVPMWWEGGQGGSSESDNDGDDVDNDNKDGDNHDCDADTDVNHLECSVPAVSKREPRDHRTSGLGSPHKVTWVGS